MNVNLEADLTEAVAPVAPPLTQEDYDRAYKLDAGIKKLADELEALKDRIKAEAELGTSVHGKVVVKVSERKDKDVEAMTELYPEDKNPTFYKSVFDAAKVAKLDASKLLYKPTIKVVSITFAQ